MDKEAKVAEIIDMLGEIPKNTWIDLAKAFSRFYNEHHIICDDKPTQDARILLTKVTGDVLKSGLSLLGIKCPEKM